MHRSLYPRQGTMLKIAFLQTDLFTEFDHQVIGEWIESFKETGNNGCQPDIYERIEICKREGRPWFREWVNAIGRRGSKGFIGGIAGAYVLWHYLSKGDPQAYYGIDRDKRLSMMVFAGKKEQAKDNQWKDLVDLIKGARCFAPYISRILSESLTIYAPHDFVRIGDREDMGVYGDDDMASFILLPKESTVMASRGPAVCSAMFDEMSHVVRQYAKSEACLDPSSRVLCADLIWRPIGALKVGDKLVGLEEEVTAGITRKLKEAKIVAVTRNVQRPYKLTFDDGSHVICSGNHRWLHHQIARWGPTRRLRVGSRIRAFVDPWETDMSYEAGYLKGFFDGEGHIIGTGKARGDGPKRKTWGLGFSQNPGPVLDHVKNLMSICGFAYRENGLNRECHQTYLRGLDESVRFLGKIRPKRLLENSSRVWVGKTPQGEYKTIVAIERLPEQVLVDLETTTHTYIAEGLVSHNSEVYESTIPALDTFGVDAFIYEPSSTWQMAGQFYDNWCQSLKVSDGTDGFGAGQIIRPEMLMFQLTSWDIYTDWERADQIPVRPGGYCYHRQKRPQQVYDEQMRRIEAANPESFRVERRSHWAAVLDAYLNPDRVDQIFEPWPPENPSNLRMVTSGKMNVLYLAHGDPSKVGANFGFAVAHVEQRAEDEFPHVVFDLLTYWSPKDFPENNNEIDYEVVTEACKGYILSFAPTEFTFDQYGASAWMIQQLRRFQAEKKLPRRTDVFERTATAPQNWEVAEAAKTAINLGLVHAPFHEQTSLELKFLQKVGEQKVDHPTAGPVQTKDCADCLFILVHALIGQQMAAFIGASLSQMTPSASQVNGFPLLPVSQQSESAPAAFSGLASFGRSQRREQGYSPARGSRFSRPPRR